MAKTIDYSKLRIIPDFDTKEWWEGARQHKYLVRKCNKCGHKWFPPLFPACAKCTSMDTGWFETAGRGVIHSYVVVVQPIVGAFVGTVPYVVAIIELDEGPRLISNVVHIEPEKVHCDMPVKVIFDLRCNGIKVPQFVPIES